jgi:ABC-type glycerol-3-phosphate transport system substrate-binding protein
MMVNNMLRKMKRSMSLLLAAAMLVSMAAGCGSSSAGNSGSTQTTAAATTAEAETAAPPVTEEMYFPNGDKQIYAVMYKPAEEKEKFDATYVKNLKVNFRPEAHKLEQSGKRVKDLVAGCKVTDIEGYIKTANNDGNGENNG